MQTVKHHGAVWQIGELVVVGEMGNECLVLALLSHGKIGCDKATIGKRHAADFKDFAVWPLVLKHMGAPFGDEIHAGFHKVRDVSRAIFTALCVECEYLLQTGVAFGKKLVWVAEQVAFAGHCRRRPPGKLSITASGGECVHSRIYSRVLLPAACFARRCS
jgi:hypothetical protein